MCAAFAKRIARSALLAAPTVVILSVALIHNILIRHPACMVLLHRGDEALPSGLSDREAKFVSKRKRVDDIRRRSKLLASRFNKLNKIDIDTDEISLSATGLEDSNESSLDCFGEEENDPLKARALDSSLWELKILRNHYSATVRTVIESLIFDEFSHAVKTKVLEPPVPFSRFEGMTLESLISKELRPVKKKRRSNSIEGQEENSSLDSDALKYPLAIRTKNELQQQLENDSFLSCF